MTRTIIFDFDGTLAIGHGLVLAYAEAMAAEVQPNFQDRVKNELARFDAGLTDYLDGYDLVASLAKREGISPGTMTNAYTVSREKLAAGQARVEAPRDLREILRELHDNARLEVATNAPDTGVQRMFERWSVTRFIDALHVNVGKPAGLYPIIQQALNNGPVLCVGDIATNDLQPAIDLGADTALVGATSGDNPTEVTMRGLTLTEIRDPLRAWATGYVHSTDTNHSEE